MRQPLALSLVFPATLVFASSFASSAWAETAPTRPGSAPTPQLAATQPQASAPSEGFSSQTQSEKPSADVVPLGKPEGDIDNAVSVFGLLSYWYASGGVGVGARYQKTLLQRAAIKRHPTIHDDIGIEAGADYFHYNFSVLNYDWSYNEFAVVAGVVWNFWFSDHFAAYPKVDVGYRFGSWSNNLGISNPTGFGGIVFQGAAGVIYKLNPVALRAEVGSGTLRLGAAYQF